MAYLFLKYFFHKNILFSQNNLCLSVDYNIHTDKALIFLNKNSDIENILNNRIEHEES